MSDRSDVAKKAWETGGKKLVPEAIIVDKSRITVDTSESARKARATMHRPHCKAKKSERSSKEALASWCDEHRWKLRFFEDKSGSPRKGIVDGVMARIKPAASDVLEIEFVQLKSMSAGLTGKGIARLKQAIQNAVLEWIGVAYDGNDIHLVAEGVMPKP